MNNAAKYTPSSGNIKVRADTLDDALAILTGRQPMVTGREGLADIKIVNAIFEAAKTGRTVTL